MVAMVADIGEVIHIMVTVQATDLGGGRSGRGVIMEPTETIIITKDIGQDGF